MSAKETEEIIKNIPKPKVVVFHGYESNLDKDRYKNIQFETVGHNIDHKNMSFEEIESKYTATIDEIIKDDRDVILLGHSLGGWWARYFAKNRKLIALLLNPVVDITKVQIPLNLNISSYIENQYPVEYTPSVSLTYYIEMGDEVIEFKNVIPKLEEEGRVVEIEGGSHQISYPEKIYELLEYISNKV